DIGARQRLAHHLCTEFSRRHVLQSTAEIADGGTHAGNHDDLALHPSLPGLLVTAAYGNWREQSLCRAEIAKPPSRSLPRAFDVGFICLPIANGYPHAGLGSLRRFNAVFAQVYRCPPSDIRPQRW